MHKKILKIPAKGYYTTVIILISIIIFGFLLRHYDFRTSPRHGATFDEFAWTWQGINLIQKHKPISWSPQPQYTQRQHLIYQGARFWLVQPYLEHPPVFGLVAGGFALLNGARNMYDVTLIKIRPLSLILGTLSILMVFLFTKEIYGLNIALISSLIYATVPTVVIGSRIVQNENFLVPFWLLSLYLISRYIKTGNKWLRNFAAILAGILSLAKVPWLVVGLSLSMILSYKGKWKDAIFVALITLSMFFLFILYGIYFDKELFFNLMRLQAARYDIVFSGFFSIFTKPLLIDRYYLDGWIIFGWFSIFFLSRNFKKHFLLLIPFIAYLVIYIFAIPDEPAHGWYRYPFYPFLLISSAVIIKEELSRISLLSVFFVLLVGLSLLSNTWETSYGFSYVVYRLFIFLAVVPLMIFLWRGKNKLMPKVILLSWFAIFIILNIFAVMNFIG